MSQYIRSRLGSVAGIVVTDFSSVVVVIVSAACVSVILVFFIEQIIDLSLIHISEPTRRS